MDTIQLMHAFIWALLGGLCVLSIGWGVTRHRGRKPPAPFFVVQGVFCLFCAAFAAQSVTVAMLPLRVPAYVEDLLAMRGAPKPAALTPEALQEFEEARVQVRSAVHRVETTVMPSSRTLYVEVTFGNRDVLLLNIAYRDERFPWLPVAIGPHRFLIESAVFIPRKRGPLHMIASGDCLGHYS